MKSLHDPHLVTVLADLVTVTDRDAFVSLCAQGLEHMPSRQTILHTCGGPGASLAKSAADFFAGRPGRDGLEDAIRAMDAVPVVRMTIAFSPSARALSTWQKDAARALSGPCILEVTVDEAVAAGAVIDMKGTLFRSVLADEIDK